MRDNKCVEWSQGLLYTQWGMNTTHPTKQMPYKTLFGFKPRVGLNTKLATEFLKNIPIGMPEEDFEKLFADQDLTEKPLIITTSTQGQLDLKLVLNNLRIKEGF